VGSFAIPRSKSKAKSAVVKCGAPLKRRYSSSVVAEEYTEKRAALLHRFVFGAKEMGVEPGSVFIQRVKLPVTPGPSEGRAEVGGTGALLTFVASASATTSAAA
jgi:hypothetical protein